MSGWSDSDWSMSGWSDWSDPEWRELEAANDSHGAMMAEALSTFANMFLDSMQWDTSDSVAWWHHSSDISAYGISEVDADTTGTEFADEDALVFERDGLTYETATFDNRESCGNDSGATGTTSVVRVQTIFAPHSAGARTPLQLPWRSSRCLASAG